MTAVTIVRKLWEKVRGTGNEVDFEELRRPLAKHWPEKSYPKIWKRWEKKNDHITWHIYLRRRDQMRALRLSDLRLARDLDAATRQKK